MTSINKTGSKENPYWYVPRDVFSEIHKIEGEQTIRLSSLDELFFTNKHGKKKLKYHSSHIKTVIDSVDHGWLVKRYVTGGDLMLFSSKTNQLFPMDLEADYIEVTFPTPFSDYLPFVERAGKYKSCQGGGWHSMEELYKIIGTEIHFYM